MFFQVTVLWLRNVDKVWHFTFWCNNLILFSLATNTFFVNFEETGSTIKQKNHNCWNDFKGFVDVAYYDDDRIEQECSENAKSESAFTSLKNSGNLNLLNFSSDKKYQCNINTLWTWRESSQECRSFEMSSSESDLYSLWFHTP